jgi:hypothetical protein
MPRVQEGAVSFRGLTSFQAFVDDIGEGERWYTDVPGRGAVLPRLHDRFGGGSVREHPRPEVRPAVLVNRARRGTTDGAGRGPYRGCRPWKGRPHPGLSTSPGPGAWATPAAAQNHQHAEEDPKSYQFPSLTTSYTASVRQPASGHLGQRASRVNPSSQVAREIFRRDSYTCRYRRRRTVDLEVLK